MKFLISSHSRSGWIGISSIGLLAPGAWRFADLAVGQRSTPRGEMIRINALGARIDELAEHRLAVADDADIDLAWRSGDFIGIDIDARDLGADVEARRRGVADDVVHPGAEHDDQIGVAERRGAHRQIRIFMIVRHDAAALRRGVERNAGLLDELLHSAQACDQITPLPDRMIGWLRLGDRVDQRIDLAGIAERPRVEQRPAATAPVDLLLGDLGVENVAGEIEIDRARLAAHRFLERDIHLLGDALEIVDAVGPFGAAAS